MYDISRFRFPWAYTENDSPKTRENIYKIWNEIYLIIGQFIKFKFIKFLPNQNTNTKQKKTIKREKKVLGSLVRKPNKKL